MIIKVCGMREAENIRQAETLGIDLMGFIFWPKSSRYVNHRPAYLPSQTKRVGVFVDESLENVLQTASDYALDYLQLHGHESPDYCRQLKDYSIIKAFNIATPADFGQTLPYEGVVDIFLFDTKGPSVGGNGKKFDWSLLTHYSGRTPFLLSGGIGPDDAASLMAFHHEQCIGIDLNSRFEQSPGLKDIGLLRRFLSQLSNQTH